MKNTKNKRVVILSKPSPYFEQCIFILKERVMSEEEKLLNEARSVAENYEKRCEKSRMLVFNDKKKKYNSFIMLSVGTLVGIFLMLVVGFFWKNLKKVFTNQKKCVIIDAEPFAL